MAHFNFVISQNAKWGHAGFYIDCHRMTVPENILLQKSTGYRCQLMYVMGLVAVFALFVFMLSLLCFCVLPFSSVNKDLYIITSTLLERSTKFALGTTVTRSWKARKTAYDRGSSPTALPRPYAVSWFQS